MANTPSDCVLCAKVVFRFEARVKVADLDEKEKAACVSMLKPNVRGALEDAANILCSPCHQKLLPSPTEEVDPPNRTSPGRLDDEASPGRLDDEATQSDPHQPVEAAPVTLHQSSLQTDARQGDVPAQSLQQNNMKDPSGDLMRTWLPALVAFGSTILGMVTKVLGSSAKWIVAVAGILILLVFILMKQSDGLYMSASNTLGSLTSDWPVDDLMLGTALLGVVLIMMKFGSSRKRIVAAAGILILLVFILTKQSDEQEGSHKGVSNAPSMGSPTSDLPPTFAVLGSTFLGMVVAGLGLSVKRIAVVAGILVLVVLVLTSQDEDVQEELGANGNDRTDACVNEEAGMGDRQAMEASITAGQSLAGTSTLALLQDGYRVTCGIEVENWTQFPLVQPHVQICRGTLALPPSDVAPATREVMVARKTSGLAEGSYGTVSWLIRPMKRRLVVMWSAPFNFNHHSNWLAVGLTSTGITEHMPGDSWFNQMYYGDSAGDLYFQLGEYYDSIQPLVYRDKDFEVEGIMGSDHKAIIKVVLFPLGAKNYAQCLRGKLMKA